MVELREKIGSKIRDAMTNEHTLMKQGNRGAAVGHVKPGFASFIQKRA